MTNIKDPEAFPNYRRTDFKTRMKLPHILCPKCKGNNFKVCVANLPSWCKILLDCHDCKKRTDLWITSISTRVGPARDTWESMEFSKKYDMIVKPEVKK